MSFLKPHLPLIILVIFTALRVQLYCENSLSVLRETPEEFKIRGFRSIDDFEERDSIWVPYQACALQRMEFDDLLIIQKLTPLLDKIRAFAIGRARKYLPSPASELLLGMTIGVDEFRKIPRFKEMLIKTGTIHVVVVSGYNISLVYTLVWAFLGSFYNRSKLILGVMAAIFYALLSGFDPPVIRSWIMGSVAYLGKYHGRSFPTLKVLFISGLLMILWQPLFLFSLSFQLSFSATLSLILFSEMIEKEVFLVSRIPSLFREDFIITVAVQILVWPLISIYFGRISLISVLVNTLILWTVPLATVMGGAFLVFFFLGDFFSRILAFLIYIPLGLFVDVVVLFSSFPLGEVDFQISSRELVIYYVAVFLVFWRSKLVSDGKKKV